MAGLLIPDFVLLMRRLEEERRIAEERRIKNNKMHRKKVAALKRELSLVDEFLGTFSPIRAKLIRHRDGKTQEELATYLGLESISTIWKYEKGIFPPNSRNVERYLEYLAEHGYDPFKQETVIDFQI